MNFCCCLFSKDPFRGFQSPSSINIEIDLTGMDKASIGTKVLHDCETKGGFPSIENIDRLKKVKLDQSSVNDTKKENKDCENECKYLIKELNEKYNVEQEENRQREATSLRDKRRKLLKLMDEKIMKNVDNFHNGRKCNISIKTKYKEFKPVMGSMSNRLKEIDPIKTNDISFDSITDIEQINTERNNNLNQLNFMLDPASRNRGDKLVPVPSMTSIQLEKIDLDLEKEIEKLDGEIMCLEHKNRRPIDYILDRFSIQDDILVRIIRIFEASQDDVVRKMRSYFEDSIYFQFRIAEKLDASQYKIELHKKI